MRQLNYQHLLYFWTVAREGSVTAASERLHLTQPTVSAQLRQLEKAAGGRLFRRKGRGLVLSDLGQVVFEYAEEIFSLGRELQDLLSRGPEGRPMRLVVGVLDVLPKLVAHSILQPVMSFSDPAVQLVVREGKFQPLAAELALHHLDLLLTDGPLPEGISIKAFHHRLGACPVALFAAPKLAGRLRRGFPGSLDGAPMLLPTSNTRLRRKLDRWLEGRRLSPRVVAESEDSALLKVFGQNGLGAFAAPTLIADAISRQYGVRQVGVAEGLDEEFYAISLERRTNHPAVLAITEGARKKLFKG